VDQTYPEESYEVLVVDNGSDDGTKSVIRSFEERYPRMVTLLIETGTQSPAAARNKGLEHGEGTVFAFVDADMTVEETWLELATESLSESGCDYIGCAIETRIPEGEETHTAKHDKIFAFNIRNYVENAHFAGTGCLVVHKRIFDAVGFFDDALVFGADKEFGNRVYDAGFEQHFEPKITMYHPARTSLCALLKKSFRIGRGQTHLYDHYPERFEAPSPLDPRNYLPLRPTVFRSRLQNAEISLSPSESVIVYLIAYLSKFVNSAGSVYERFGEVPETRS
jgi:glycosyltransferase involved in cell wall biosynthesis